MNTIEIPLAPDYEAPDGSQIRLLPTTARGGLVHCTLPRGRITRPVKHRTVEEIWYVMSGTGALWRSYGCWTEETELVPGVSVLIPFQTGFQFRSEADDDLILLIATFPGWPGPDEAVPIEAGVWEPTFA